jgi:sporulation protein YlmC with PRC-barrel domain
MAEAVPFAIGADVTATDGPCGHISRVVVDPLARSVTHLVVEPVHWEGLGRLVPLSLVDASGEGIRLRCTQSEFQQLGPAEETEFIAGGGSYGPYGGGEILTWPYYGLGGMGAAGGAAVPPAITYDTVPAGEVEVRRGDHVHAADGSIGHVQGLVIDRGSAHVTHVLLREGHLWGRKEVAIPISAVTAVEADGIRLSLTKQEVGDLPPVDIDHLS